MKRRSFGLLVVLLLGLGLCYGCSISYSEPRLIDGFGVWTLKELGYSDIGFLCTEEIETRSVEFRLPKKAAQGPESWYLIHLNFHIKFGEQSEEDLAYVSASTNGYCCAQVKFRVKREDDLLKIDWSTVDLINGKIDYFTSSSVADVSFKNYLQIRGVCPGLNTLTFQLEQYEGCHVESLRILNSSGIECTPIPPPRWDTRAR
ncbi:MAG: hypothetical protein CO103_05175 [Chloroflexi bacterium CG_4_9_14_3_um_filter_45_9]|nr:MAG: hypothetical protein CO103_05175 [Chloroflexi bacterium CG_4_9_14_3_um_filter_45_9]